MAFAMRKVLTVTLLGLSIISSVVAEQGKAVIYSSRFQGRPTASKETFNQEALTAAHKTLPFGTKVKVTNTANQKSVVLKINDRMASRNSNIIDVTRKAAQELGFVKAGSAQVAVEVVQ